MASETEQNVNPIRGQLLLKLLEIESTRCNAKTDEDERTESLAQLLEGDDHIIERVHSGMKKYMSLLGIEEGPSYPPMMTVAEMQESSVFGDPARPRRSGTTVVQVSTEEAATWDRLKRQCGQNGFDFNRMELMLVETSRGGRLSPEDQITCTFRILR